MFWWTKKLLIVAGVVVLSGCSRTKVEAPKSFLNFDSLVNNQVLWLNRSKFELSKSVSIDGKQEQTRFVPDSTQWANEFEIFRQLDAVNKAAFRDAYVVNDMRDTNSNLTVREVKAQQPVPVSVVRFYYLRNPSDLRRIEATWFEENALYTNTRRMMIEFENTSSGHIVHRYRIEGVQKMVMDDSVHFVIAGEVAM